MEILFSEISPEPIAAASLGQVYVVTSINRHHYFEGLFLISELRITHDGLDVLGLSSQAS